LASPIFNSKRKISTVWRYDPQGLRSLRIICHGLANRKMPHYKRFSPYLRKDARFHSRGIKQ
jgi:hypothetical protein